MSDTSRVEAFSDGVFAIVITLLVLEISVPAGSEGDLLQAVLDQWPSYLAYVVSFATVGIIWINHHAVLGYVRRVDRGHCDRQRVVAAQSAVPVGHLDPVDLGRARGQAGVGEGQPRPAPEPRVRRIGGDHGVAEAAQYPVGQGDVVVADVVPAIAESRRQRVAEVGGPGVEGRRGGLRAGARSRRKQAHCQCGPDDTAQT